MLLTHNSFLTAFEMPLGKAALIALLGIAIVFTVLAILVGLLTLFKLIFNIKIVKKDDAPALSTTVTTDSGEEEEEVIAVIMAALTAMGDEQTATAPFRIKSIRKLK